MTPGVFHLPIAIVIVHGKLCMLRVCKRLQIIFDFLWSLVRSYFMRIECSFRSWRREKWIIIWQSPVCRGRLTGWSRGPREQYWLFTNAEIVSLRLWIQWEQTRVVMDTGQYTVRADLRYMDTGQYEVSILGKCRSLSIRGQLGCRSLSIWRSTYPGVVHRHEMDGIYITLLVH